TARGLRRRPGRRAQHAAPPPHARRDLPGARARLRARGAPGRRVVGGRPRERQPPPPACAPLRHRHGGRRPHPHPLHQRGPAGARRRAAGLLTRTGGRTAASDRSREITTMSQHSAPPTEGALPTDGALSTDGALPSGARASRRSVRMLALALASALAASLLGVAVVAPASADASGVTVRIDEAGFSKTGTWSSSALTGPDGAPSTYASGSSG